VRRISPAQVLRWSGRHPVFLTKNNGMCYMPKRIESIAPFVPIFFFTSFFRLSCFLVCIASLAVLGLVIAFKTLNSTIVPSCIFWASLCFIIIMNYKTATLQSKEKKNAVAYKGLRYRIGLILFAAIVWGIAMFDIFFFPN
jgi:hypothetical protein